MFYSTVTHSESASFRILIAGNVMIAAQELVCLAAFCKYLQIMKLIYLILNQDINSTILIGSSMVMSICCLIMLKLAELRCLQFKTDK